MVFPWQGRDGKGLLFDDVFALGLHLILRDAEALQRAPNRLGGHKEVDQEPVCLGRLQKNLGDAAEVIQRILGEGQVHRVVDAPRVGDVGVKFSAGLF